MVSLLDRFRRLFRREEPPRAEVLVLSDALSVAGLRLPWDELEAVTAFEYPGYIGGELCLHLEFGDRAITLSQDSECWEALVSRIDELPQTRVESLHWLLELMKHPEEPIQVLA